MKKHILAAIITVLLAIYVSGCAYRATKTVCKDGTVVITATGRGITTHKKGDEEFTVDTQQQTTFDKLKNAASRLIDIVGVKSRDVGVVAD